MEEAKIALKFLFSNSVKVHKERGQVWNKLTELQDFVLHNRIYYING